jgi:hypothetical protein
MGNNYSQINSGHAAVKFIKTYFLYSFNSPNLILPDACLSVTASQRLT